MASKLTRWSPLENQVYRLLKTHQVTEAKALIAVSGGQDSMVLAEVMARLAPALGLEIFILHLHHGGASAYRKKARNFVKKWSEEKKLPFLTEEAKKDLRSEDEARQFREKSFSRLQKQTGASFLFLGHHQDDLLETRLLRLLRGTGPQGLEAMATVRDGKVRPFLGLGKAQLRTSVKNLDWVEDPSNAESEYLRNWLRHQWLPALEKKSPGAKKAMARSLELLLESHEKGQGPVLFHSEKGISKAEFLSLTEIEKRQCLARYVLSLKIRHFTQNHLREILKHLDNSKNIHTFTVAQLNWTLTKDRIFAVRRE